MWHTLIGHLLQNNYLKMIKNNKMVISSRVGDSCPIGVSADSCPAGAP